MIMALNLVSSAAKMCLSKHQPDSCPDRTIFLRPDLMKKVGVISGLYRIFRQNLDRFKQLMFWEEKRIKGKPLLDLWCHESLWRRITVN